MLSFVAEKSFHSYSPSTVNINGNSYLSLTGKLNNILIVGTLTNLAPHLGKTYRPTGPRLLSPPQIAEVFGKVLRRKVTYLDAPFWMMSKAARASSVVPNFQIAQLHTYIEDYKRNAFGIGVPTNAVLEVSGQEPEDFETTIRRYYANAPYANRNMGALSRTLLFLMKTILTPAMNLAAFNRTHNFPRIRNSHLAADSRDWQQTHADAALEGDLPKAVVTSLVAQHS